MTLMTLDKICNDFKIILLDTCVLNGFLECYNLARSAKLKDRINSQKEEKNSYIFFRRGLNQEKTFLITNFIFNELNCEENLSIRETLLKYDFLKISKKEYEYYHEICSRKKEKNKLLKIIKKKRKILNFSPDENIEYANYFERNFYLKSKNNLSEPDYDLLISGAVLSVSRGNTAILSNDFPLLYSYQSLIYGEKLSAEKFGFFIRPKREFFQKAYTNSQINLNS